MIDHGGVPHPSESEPTQHPWPLRHVTKLMLGGGLLLLADSYTTNIVVDRYDPDFEYAAEQDTPESYRSYVEQGGRADKARGELARLHRRVSAHLSERGAPRPDGLDPLLAVLRERVDERIVFEAEPIVIEDASFSTLHVTGASSIVDIRDALGHQDYECASGLSKAFATATGGNTIVVDGLASATPGGPRISMSWSARASGSFYGGRGATTLFPSIVLSATLRLVAGSETIATFESTVEPGPDIEFTTFAGTGFLGPDVSAVTGGIIEAACTRLGEAWIDELTGLAPAIAKPRETPKESCQAGEPQACLVVGEDLREDDPVAALEAFRKGCYSRGIASGKNCLAVAELALARGGDDAWADAVIALESGCDANDGIACARAGELRLTRADDPDPSTLAEAYLLLLRGCDLGASEACMAASTAMLVEKPGREPSRVRARLLASRACAADVEDACERVEILTAARETTIHGVAIENTDTPFDVRWGMWFQHEPAEIVWFATNVSVATTEARLATSIAEGRARVLAAADVPPGVRPPEGTRVIFGLASAPVNLLGPAQRCGPCTADANADPFFLRVGCTCLPL